MNPFDWSLRDDELGWNEEGTELCLTLDEPLCDGFRVRVEWSELEDAQHRLPPLPAERELGASYVVVISAETTDADSPLLGSLPLPGTRGIRRDLTIELYPSQPLAVFDPQVFDLRCNDEPVPYHLETNRNPPDWIYLQLEAALAPHARVELTAPAKALRSTRGVPLAEPLRLEWETGGSPPRAAVPEPAWSEPPPNLSGHFLDRIEAALRFEGQPLLDSAVRLRERIRLVDVTTGAIQSGLEVDLDRTPAHYRTIFVRSTRDFAGLEPATRYALRWDGLEWPGITDPVPGELAFETVAMGESPIFLAGCPHVSIIATREGSHLQVALQVYTQSEITEGWVELEGKDGFRCPLAVQSSPHFRDAVDGTLRTSAPVLLSTTAASPVLPDVAEPSTRHLVLRLRDAQGRTRTFPGIGFDMSRNAIQNDEIVAGPRPRYRWDLSSPCDSQHIAIHTPNGTPRFGGLFDASVREFELPRGWDLAPGRYLLQHWLMRATPEDDLWDFAVRDHWFDVVDS